MSQDWRHPTAIKRERSATTSISDKYHSAKHKIKKGGFKKLFNFLFLAGILCLLIGGIASIGVFAWVSKDLPSPDGVINRKISVSTKIYDRTSQTVLYDIHGNIKRTLIKIGDLPKYTIDATLAAEDRNFYNHKGFSVLGILRSALVNAITGEKSQGGSTLTQQFVKNAILTSEKTYTRKLKEIIISYRIESSFTKDQILQMYFNEIPYGSVNYGIEAASQSFFGKSAKDLTIAESAILASIPKATTLYSPYGNNLDRLFGRQQWIIDQMVSLGYITQADGDKAKKEKIIFKPLRDSIIAPHFVMYIKDLLSEQYGEEYIDQEGLKVITSLDLDKQKIAEKAVKDGVEKNGAKYLFNNASLVALDPKTGQVLAMVGSVDYFNNAIDGQVNVSLRPRQPGSSMKPIVYTAAFIKGYTPSTVLYDVNTNFDTTGNKEYSPKDYDLKERGPVTIREALAQSLNTPAVKATYLTGIDTILDLTDKLGYTTLKDRSRFGLSLVLGGGEVKLLEHAGAYATLAAEGVRHEINPILRIENKDGKVLYEFKDKSENIIDPEITRLTADVMSDNEARTPTFGANNKLILPDRPVAAKTGTTNDFHDAWTMGFTPSLVAGVWVGNNNNQAMKTGADGSVIAAPIWNQFMLEALKNTPPENFIAPQTIITGKPVLDGVKVAEKIYQIDTMSGKLATQYTPKETIKEIRVRADHSILQFVNKDNPRGDVPTNPASDSQYSNWEDAVQRWASEQGYSATSSAQGIPTDYDNTHLAEDQPQVIIVTPLPKQNIKESIINVEVTANSRRGIKELFFYLDDTLLSTTNNVSETNLDISGFDNGFHTLTIKAKDDLKNMGTASVEINLLGGRIMPVLNWTSPKNNESITLPITLKASIVNSSLIKKVDFYFIKQGSSTEQYLNFIEPTTSNVTIKWDKKVDLGNYTIYGYMFDQAGKKYKTEELKVIVN